jgi:hypothetical protein
MCECRRSKRLAYAPGVRAASARSSQTQTLSPRRRVPDIDYAPAINSLTWASEILPLSTMAQIRHRARSDTDLLCVWRRLAHFTVQFKLKIDYLLQYIGGE